MKLKELLTFVPQAHINIERAVQDGISGDDITRFVIKLGVLFLVKEHGLPEDLDEYYEATDDYKGFND